MTQARPTLAFALMDAPFESARTTTAFRLLDIAARRGFDIRVFAYEGAVMLPFAKQQPHPNAVHGRSAEEENHPLPRISSPRSSRRPSATAAASTG
jgi:tRNA 2-thiouridine synthesizing protein D